MLCEMVSGFLDADGEPGREIPCKKPIAYKDKTGFGICKSCYDLIKDEDIKKEYVLAH